MSMGVLYWSGHEGRTELAEYAGPIGSWTTLHHYTALWPSRIRKSAGRTTLHTAYAMQWTLHSELTYRGMAGLEHISWYVFDPPNIFSGSVIDWAPDLIALGHKLVSLPLPYLDIQTMVKVKRCSLLIFSFAVWESVLRGQGLPFDAPWGGDPHPLRSRLWRREHDQLQGCLR